MFDDGGALPEFYSLGIRLDKVDITRFDMICPDNLKDLTQAGSVYIVIHRPKDEDKECEIEKRKHFGMAIDIAGSSTATQFIATHYDLYVVSSTDHTTYVDSRFKTHTWDHYSLVKKVGQIPLIDIQAYSRPNYFAKKVEHQLIYNVHIPMCTINQGDKWSSTLNYQTFTRSCIQYLQFDFPQDITVVSDVMPTMTNFYLNGSLFTNKGIETTDEALAT